MSTTKRIDPKDFVDEIKYRKEISFLTELSSTYSFKIKDFKKNGLLDKPFKAISRGSSCFTKEELQSMLDAANEFISRLDAFVNTPAKDCLAWRNEMTYILQNTKKRANPQKDTFEYLVFITQTELQPIAKELVQLYKSSFL